MKAEERLAANLTAWLRAAGWEVYEEVEARSGFGRADGIPKSMQVGKTIRVPRSGGGWQQFQERRNTEWGTLVAHVGAQHAPLKPWAGRIVFETYFWVPRPASAPKRRTTYPTTRPDLRNLTNKIEDVFNGVLWRDDAQIVRWVQTKDYHPAGRVGLDVVVRALDPQEPAAAP